MKRTFLILFLSGCVSAQDIKKDNEASIKFSDDLNFEQFKIKLDVYAENSSYPNIDD